MKNVGKGLALIIIGLSIGWVATSPDWEPLIVLIGSISAFVGMKFAESRKKPALELFSNREDYLDRVIRQVSAAQSQILLCVHTLSPSRPENKLEELHNALANKAREGADVRVLAPTGESRTEASYQLKKLGVQVRHLTSLSDSDISFSVFDSLRSSVPTQSGSLEETVAGVTVHSAKLADLLKGYFRDMWFRYDTLIYYSFVRYMVDSSVHEPVSTPLSVYAEKLGIPEKELEIIFPAYGDRTHKAYFFVIGRPASGKTTVAAAIKGHLQRNGVPHDHIYQFNDYAALYERFSTDKQQAVFQAADRGGFRVLDFSVLDTVLKQADLDIRLAYRSHRAFVIEFSRPSYIEAFFNFDRKILDECVIVHVKCPPALCDRRNERRVAVSDDHCSGYVPPDIMHEFYESDDVAEVKRIFGAKVVELDTETVQLDRLDEALAKRLRDLAISPNKSLEIDA